jgi:flagellar hook-length control protein FliK
MSIPDAGTSAKAAAASPQDDGAFGAMLAQAQGAPASPAGDAGSKAQSSNAQASGTQAAGSQSASPQTPDAQATNASADAATIPDPATLAAAIANQVPLVAQMEAAKTPDQNQDPTAGDKTDAPVSESGKQVFDTAKSRVATQEAAPQAGALAVTVSDSGTTPPTAPVPNTTPTTTPAVAAQDDAHDAATDDDSGAAILTADAATETAAQESESAVVTPKAAPIASNTPKTEKPDHAEDDDTSTGPQTSDTSATPDLSSRVAAQLLGAPATPASQSQAKGESKPEDVLAPGLAAAAQASASRPAPSDKNANPKAAAAANAHGASDPRSQARDTQGVANAATPVANGSDGLNRAAANISPPGEHAAKAESVAAAPNLAPANPTIPNHAGLDVPAAGIANAPPAPSNDASVPVKLSVSTPGTTDSPSFDALALKIAARSLNGENNFSVRLDPPELGRIEVNLNVRADGHAQAELSADKPQTLQLLQQDASQLERALKDAGLNLAGGLAFSLKGDGRSQTWRDTQNGSRGRSLQISATDAVSANAAIAAGSAFAAHAYGLSTTRLDISV